jgi:orotate phosphoribosyltransferase
MSELIQSLVRVGAIQFGRFESQENPGTFAPIAINFRYIPSYPPILKALAAEITPLVQIDGITHLLAMPATVPLGTAISLTLDLPLVYPVASEPHVIEGAYDANVPTVLLTDVLMNGEAELAMVKRVKGMGLIVKAVVAVLDLGQTDRMVGDLPSAAWRHFGDLLPEIPNLTPSMRSVVKQWLGEQA